MFRALSAGLVAMVCIASAGAHADETASGGVFHDIGAWTADQVRDVVSARVDDRMRRVSLGVLNGESRAARFSIENEATGTLIQGGLTFECSDTMERLQQGVFNARSAEELAEKCSWHLWDFSLQTPADELGRVAQDTMELDDVQKFLNSKNASSDDIDLLQVQPELSPDKLIRARDYTTAQCGTVGDVLSWLEGFKPTPVDIERFGEDTAQPGIADYSTYYRTSVFSRVKSGSIDFTYNGYAGEAADMALFLTTALDQCVTTTDAEE